MSALTYHSANVVEGSIFVAIKGTRFDGHEFVRQAIDRGATCVVVENPLESVQGVTVIQVNNTRAALAHLASRFYGLPSQKLTVIGITGTNGKTTTTYLLESILAACGHRVRIY